MPDELNIPTGAEGAVDTPEVPTQGTEAPQTPEQPNVDDKPQGEEDNYSPFLGDYEEPTDDAGEDIDDEDMKAINKVVEKKTGTTNRELESLKRQVEVGEYLSKEGNEALRDYSDKIKAVAQDPRTKGMNIQAVVALAVGLDNLVKIGAERERQASQEASRSHTGGSATRAERKTGLPNAWDLSDEQFNKMTTDVMRGR